ncbi:MAG: ABC transporter permease [Bacteroidaceae bacterium]
MKTIANIIHIWYHELITIMRDKGILIFILFVPLAYPLLYSYVYTNEVVREVPVAVIDESHTALSREFLRKIDASPDVSIQAYSGDMAEAQRLLKKQKVYGIIRIPASFTQDIWHGEQTHVGLYCDMCSMLYYKNLLLTATNVSLEMNKDIKVERYLPATTERQAEITRMPIEYEQTALYNPQSGFAAFLIPPVLMLIIQQTLFLGIGMSMGDAREKYMGSVIPFHKAYVNPIHIVLGKTLFYFLLYMMMGIYMFTFVTYTFGLPQLGHYSTFLIFLVPNLLSCIFMGMILSFLVWRREDCIMLFVFLSVPCLFLSGISWPGSAMPIIWKYISWLFPSTFGMNGYVRITGMGASLHDIAFELKGLWIQVCVYFIAACLFYHRYTKKGNKSSKHSDFVIS